LKKKKKKKKRTSKIGGEIAKKMWIKILYNFKKIVYSQLTDFMLFLGIKTLEKMPHTQKKKK
jgi:hypothetical protein